MISFSGTSALTSSSLALTVALTSSSDPAMNSDADSPTISTLEISELSEMPLEDFHDRIPAAIALTRSPLRSAASSASGASGHSDTWMLTGSSNFLNDNWYASSATCGRNTETILSRPSPTV